MRYQVSKNYLGDYQVDDTVYYADPAVKIFGKYYKHKAESLANELATKLNNSEKWMAR